MVANEPRGARAHAQLGKPVLIVARPRAWRSLSLLSPARSLAAVNGSIQEDPLKLTQTLPVDDLHERRRQVCAFREGRVQDVVRRRAGRP